MGKEQKVWLRMRLSLFINQFCVLCFIHSIKFLEMVFNNMYIILQNMVKQKAMRVLKQKRMYGFFFLYFILCLDQVLILLLYY